MKLLQMIVFFFSQSWNPSVTMKGSVVSLPRTVLKRWPLVQLLSNALGEDLGSIPLPSLTHPTNQPRDDRKLGAGLVGNERRSVTRQSQNVSSQPIVLFKMLTRDRSQLCEE
jgi:hypothetical protein